MSSAKLRVVFVSSTGRTTGGAEESLLLLLQNLPLQIEAIVVAFEDGAFVEALRGLGLDVRVHRVSRELLRVRREENFFPFFIQIARECVNLSRLLRELRPDVVHANSVKSGFIGTIAARLAGIPVVMHLRDILEGRGRAFYGFIAKHVANDAIAVSNIVADWYGLARTKVVYNAIDLSAYTNLPSRAQARLALGLAPDAAIVGIVGRINRWKGHDRFIRIVAGFSERHRVVGAIVGAARFRDEEFEEELVAKVAADGLQDRIVFVPWTTDVTNVYRALDVLCNFSLREPFGRTMLEAAACSTPSVCFDDGGGLEIFGDETSFSVVAAGDETACAAQLLRLISDEGAREEAQALALRAAARFPIDVHVREVVAIFQRLARRRRVASPMKGS